MIQVIDGVRYNSVLQVPCVGCAAYAGDFSKRTPLCERLYGDGANCRKPHDVIWLTDVDFAAHRLTQGDNDEL